MHENLKENEYIGIHCTHGINRTGYAIIYYLCKIIGMRVKEAIDTF
jgi:protein-tyrosine phosphatase